VRGAPALQTTAAISAGSSGGGLFDVHGRLVGVTIATVQGGQALNFATAAVDAAALLSDLCYDPEVAIRWPYVEGSLHPVPQRVDSIVADRCRRLFGNNPALYRSRPVLEEKRREGFLYVAVDSRIEEQEGLQFSPEGTVVHSDAMFGTVPFTSNSPVCLLGERFRSASPRP
jgi:hypothetical protein